MKEIDPTPAVFRELGRAAERLLTAAATLSDAAVAAPSRLPGWTRAQRPGTCTPRRILVIRLREPVLHLVDLDVGHEVADIPAAAVGIVLDDAVGSHAEAEKMPACTLTDAEGVEFARFGGGGPVVRGARTELLAWLSGRDDGARLDAPDGLPVLPPWI
ncbi:hypothetical protein [Streptomyces malaysiense]|uniref:Uncharacterized protein n=1 Tax=Streptomyces malaysiense TaxID=1428626 RepID=A0A1J4QA19_9ACTN|nr:hypothetical protein [Streptomyces malaysiense]OIK29230.1 hypothetical protein VT52_001875 [Streptomyces malaysiense]